MKQTLPAEVKIVESVTKYVRDNKIRVANPNYLESHTYSWQWKVRGSTYYYQLPNKGLIIAIIDAHKGIFKFDVTGLTLE